MKPFAALILSLFLLPCALHTLGAESLPPSAVLPAAVHEIAPAEVNAWLAEHPDTLIIDARTEEERRTRGHILNSRHHDHFHGQKALDALVAQLDKSKPCLLYCALGGRSQLMALDLHKLGFQNLLHLRGGFNAWVAEGLPVTK